VLIAGFPAGPWGTNCYVAATSAGQECVVIDPGKDAADGVAALIRDHDLKPVAVLLTHGHIDHMWSVTPVAGGYDATAYIHASDRHLLTDPMAGISADTATMLLGGDYTWAEPDRVTELTDGATLELAGLEITVDHTPGHTPGSVTFRTPYDATISQVMFAGDLLFAGSVGRTDLPGGDHAVMQNSLRDKVLTLADDIVVLPGHGAQTSIGAERRTNPFLQELLAGERAT
jgi:hydroxyacylglutathione hydrolase